MNALRRLLLAVAAASIAVPASAQVGANEGEMFVKAVREGKSSEALKLLRDKPILVNARDASGKTVLITAIENRDLDWAGYLIAQGADPNLQLRNGDTALITAARLGMQEVTEWLISAGARVNETNRMGESALIVAVQGRQTPIVRVLLDSGADPDRPDSAAGYSARDYAKRDARTPELLRLIEAKKPAS